MELSTSHVLIGFALTLLAGLSTGFGSALAFFGKRTNTKRLSFFLGFSAGVMIYVSFVELFPSSRHALDAALGAKAGSWIAVISFFGGFAISALIDMLVPSFENPHEMKKIEDMQDAIAIRNHGNAKLLKMGVFSALAIAIHNFPEGLATLAAALKDPQLGLSIAIAIAIHNIPEGIAVSIPIFYATGNRKKAFTYSFLSGLAEPAGALIGFVVLYPFMNDITFGVIFGLIAGIMVFVSLDELLPSAHEYGEHHLETYGLVAGMLVMALSLLMF